MNKPNTTELHGHIVTLDGLPVGQTHDVMEFLHRYQGQSTDYALTHGGYAVESRPAVVRGYMAYLTIKDRRGYGVDGWIVRTVEDMQYMALQSGGELTRDAVFSDHVAAPVLDALEHALNYLTGDLQNIGGELSAWIQLARRRFGIPTE